MLVGGRRGPGLLYELVATTGYVQDAESQATLVPFEALDAATPKTRRDEEEEAEPPAPRRSARQRRQPARAERAVSGNAAADARRGRRRGLPVGLRGGPRLQLLTTIEAQSTRARSFYLRRPPARRASAETIRTPPPLCPGGKPAAPGASRKSRAGEFDASVAQIAKVAFVPPASGAVPTPHWALAPMEGRRCSP